MNHSLPSTVEDKEPGIVNRMASRESKPSRGTPVKTRENPEKEKEKAESTPSKGSRRGSQATPGDSCQEQAEGGVKRTPDKRIEEKAKGSDEGKATGSGEETVKGSDEGKVKGGGEGSGKKKVQENNEEESPSPFKRPPDIRPKVNPQNSPKKKGKKKSPEDEELERRVKSIEGQGPEATSAGQSRNEASASQRNLWIVKFLTILGLSDEEKQQLNKHHFHQDFYKRLKKAIALGNENALDKLVKERYPTFRDAVQELDYCLNLCFNIANLTTAWRIQGLVQECRSLTVEFEHYVMASHSLRKVFHAIKGMYYQADIAGETVIWKVPHKDKNDPAEDVDEFVATIIHFHTRMLSFVLFKLNLLKDAEPDVFDDPENPDSAEQARLEMNPREFQKLFTNMKFFLNREVLRESFTFIIRSFGGQVSWDKNVCSDATYQETDETITHQLFGAPNSPLSTSPANFSQDGDLRTGLTKADCQNRLLCFVVRNKCYVNSQWVLDCVNNRRLLPTKDYLEGAKLPPHWSPFVEEHPPLPPPAARQK